MSATAIGPIIKIILYVSDVDAQVRFYRDRLGLRVLYPQGIEDYSNEGWVTLDTGACILALHAGGERRLGGDSPKFCFSVTGIEEVRQDLIRRGVAVGEIRSAASGIRVCDGVDPEGNRFSFDEHLPTFGA